ncbi:hypothetical protein AB0K23_20825 [Streptomyces sp. NPDC049602]|uniref:hypothetical protein n=1 Tax=Streptomyces sp. NPDC049602 TaxID=3155504 RepID=UPI00341E7BF5
MQRLIDRHVRDIEDHPAELRATKAVLLELAERAAVPHPASVTDTEAFRVVTACRVSWTMSAR